MRATNLFKKLAGSVALLALVAACSKAVQVATPQEPDSGTACALDGMVLKDHPGPKAQIHYAEGAPEYFCDLKELFESVLTPEQKRVVAAVYVQDMGKTAWEHPEGNWIDAKAAIYVVGSKKHGSMGPTFGSFSNVQDAEAFVKKEGGKVVRYAEVTPDMLDMKVGSHDNSMH